MIELNINRPWNGVSTDELAAVPTEAAFDPLPHIERLQFLESRFGATTSYRTLEPFPVYDNRPLSLQSAARRIADFLGLTATMFIVTARGAIRHAGAIELDGNAQTAFIEVSGNTASSPVRLLGTLAHEITHKLLEANGIPPTMYSEYEYLTDTAAIFFGLGKLILNACETESTTVFSDGSRTTTRYRLGYLGLNQAALVYNLVCYMRGLPADVIEPSLQETAKAAVGRIYKAYGAYFRKSAKGGQIDPTIDERTESCALALQATLTEVDCLVREITSIMDDTVGHNKDVHISIKKVRDTITALRRVEIYDPCARYLRTIAVETEAFRACERWNSDLRRLRSRCAELAELAATAKRISSNGRHRGY